MDKDGEKSHEQDKTQKETEQVPLSETKGGEDVDETSGSVRDSQESDESSSEEVDESIAVFEDEKLQKVVQKMVDKRVKKLRREERKSLRTAVEGKDQQESQSQAEEKDESKTPENAEGDKSPKKRKRSLNKTEKKKRRVEREKFAKAIEIALEKVKEKEKLKGKGKSPKRKSRKKRARHDESFDETSNESSSSTESEEDQEEDENLVWIIPANITESAQSIRKIHPIQVSIKSEQYKLHKEAEGINASSSEIFNIRATNTKPVEPCPASATGRIEAQAFVDWLQITLSRMRLAGVTSEASRWDMISANGGIAFLRLFQDCDQIKKGKKVPNQKKFPFSFAIAKICNHFSSHVERAILAKRLHNSPQEERDGISFAQDILRQVKFMDDGSEQTQFTTFAFAIQSQASDEELKRTVATHLARKSNIKKLMKAIAVASHVKIRADEPKVAQSAQQSIAAVVRTTEARNCGNCNFASCKGDETCRAKAAKCNACQRIGHFAARCSFPRKTGNLLKSSDFANRGRGGFHSFRGGASTSRGGRQSGGQLYRNYDPRKYVKPDEKKVSNVEQKENEDNEVNK